MGHANLTVKPEEGYAATHFTGMLTGVRACATTPAGPQDDRSQQTLQQNELFQWDGASLSPDGGTGGVLTDAATDSATINFTVPATAEGGAHEVAVLCPSGRVTAPFKVLTPTIVVMPEQGYAGSSFAATVSGFDACTPADMSFQWDDYPLAPGPDGRFAFTVPEDATAAPHSVTASCGSATAKPATFTVLPTSDPTLVLDPSQGAPGSSLTATLTGFDPCTHGDTTFQWDDRAPPETANPNPDGTFRLTVPLDASTEAHTVTASCGNMVAPAKFTVLTVPTPTLSLEPGYGQPGSDVTAQGSGFACDGDVQLHWDDTLLSEGLPGTFAASFTVPPTASPLTGHSVTASCRNNADIKDTQTFTVTSRPKPIPEQPDPALTLQPTSGRAEDLIVATGDRFLCASHSGPVTLVWDDGTRATDAPLDRSGHFTTSIQVPRTDGGRMTLRATCADGVVLAADFTVLGSPTSPSPPPDHDYRWVLWLIVGVAAVAALVHALRHRRPPKPPTPPHVHAVGHADGAPTVIARETPGPGEARHTLRLEAHADPGTQSVREVDDDYTDAH
ncbi:hypothetical protein QQ44_09770 [Mycolicibacterium setense]|uniref:Ig-like domain-containing protein n=1 Tax=Mycolicibacterium setense TaxID=431269 RepID=A0ABR4YUZ8_9MYCO|nr:hypothetical protein QQ44_09770 [Mycolicibacterium setense]